MATDVEARLFFSDTSSSPYISSAIEDPTLSVVDQKSNQLARSTLESQGNGDFVLTPFRTGVYMTADLIGGIRQMAESTQAIACLAHASSAVARTAGVISPIGLLLTGPQAVVTAVALTIPDAYAALDEANKELKEAQGNGIAEAEHAVEIAKLGVANHYSFLGMGISQTASGAVLMMCPGAAKVFHYTAILTGHVAHAALVGTSIALGAVYTVRGGIMLVRSAKGHQLVSKFRDKFNEIFKNDDHDKTIKFLKDQEARGDAYFERRIDPSCLEIKDDEGNVIGKYTADGIKMQGEGTPTPYNTDEAKIEYLSRVDKGIFTQIMKHRVAIIIAAAMIIGGITAIILAVMTGGVAAVVLGLVSAVFFMSMEYLFLTYDSTPLFEKLTDHFYTLPASLQTKLTSVITPITA